MTARTGLNGRMRVPVFVSLALLGLASFCRPAAARDTCTVVVGGVSRTFLVDPGKDAATTPSPLVFVFHGYTGNALSAAGLGIAKAWPEATVVYPQGLVLPFGGTGWQRWLGEFEDRDVRFVDAMLTDLAAAYRVDPRRVYATGISDGGRFTWVLFAARPERFAAFASVIYPDRGNLAWAGVPRPALYMCGDQDPENNPADYAEWTRDQLLRLNGCGTESVEWMPGVLLYQPCASGQPVLYSRFHGGHTWPKTATPAVVSFFQGQALPADPPAAAPPPAACAGEIAAGTGQLGTTGEGGFATATPLAWPSDVTLDPAGNLFIADDWSGRILRVNRDGMISTVAGNGTAGFGGDGGAAVAARLNFPAHIAVDSLGQLFIADAPTHRIRKVAPDGTITTLVGEGGTADPAPLATPAGMAIDRSGNLFLADPSRHVIRKFAGVAAPGLVAGAPLP